MPGPGTWQPGDVLTADDLNAIGAWTSYTPVLAQNGTRTCTVNYAKYVQINKLCFVNVDLTCTTTGSTGDLVTVTLPITASTSTGNLGGCGLFFDSSATDVMNVWVNADGSTAVRFLAESSTNSVSGIGNNPSLALGNGDVLSFSLVYETV
jgi:hypothetical protein